MQFIYEGEDQAGPYDLPDERTVFLTNDKSINVFRDGQYGFWKIKYDHGMISPKLMGNFTTFEKALKEIELYFNLKGVYVKKDNAEATGNTR